MKLIRKRLTYANVMSSIAVFLVLGGGAAYAAKKIGSNEIKGNSISTGKLKKEAITTAKVKNGSITTNKIANDAVTTAKIAKDAVTGEKVNESTLGEVPSAAKATTATTAGSAATASIGQSPVAYARVNSEGELIAASSRGIAPSNVSLQSTSAYCFTGLTFAFKTAMAVVDYGDEFAGGSSENPTVSVALGEPFSDCGGTAQLEVAGSDNTGFAPQGFFIWFYN